MVRVFGTKLVQFVIGLVALATAACGSPQTGGTEGTRLSGAIPIDGSSTVFPITEAIAEEFGKIQPDVRVTVGISGTGGGFKKFCARETVISDASRPIKEEERKACREAGVEYIELPVAFDGLSVMVNPRNDWVTQMTIDDLKKIWQPEAQGTVTRWNQVRPEWPDRPLVLFGAGTDSGTYDYFTEVVVGKEGSSRGDFTGSEDDNVLVQGIAGDTNSLGFFGFAYYEENRDKLNLVPIVDPKTGKAVLPSTETINDGTYSPLSRPLFIYVEKSAASRPEVKAFVEFYLSNPKLISSTGFVELPERMYEIVRERFERGVTGSVFEKGPHTGVTIESLFGAESDKRDSTPAG